MISLTRRAFAGGMAVMVGGSVAGVSLVSSACDVLTVQKPTRVPRIGYLSPGPREGRETDWIDPFLSGLRDQGYVEGQTIAVEWRCTSDASAAGLAELAADLVRLPIVLIVTVNTPAAVAAKQATRAIPIVAIGVTYPVETGLVASLGRPGGNLTGVRAIAPGFNSKFFDLLRDMVPGLCPSSSPPCGIWSST